jgi:hypothetical protein
MIRPLHAELLDMLQNATDRGNGGATDQSIHGSVGLGTACKEETSRMKNGSIKSSVGKHYINLWVEEISVFTEKFLYMYYIYFLYLLSICEI